MTRSVREPAFHEPVAREARVTLAAGRIAGIAWGREVRRDPGIVEPLASDGLSSGADDHPRATPAPSVDPEDV